MSTRGWVYIIDNEAMSNILKIGYSTKDPILRARDFDGSGLPYNYRLVFDALVEEPRIVEQAAHAMLASKRERKEWFRCSREEAIAAIRTCAKTVIIERNYSKASQSSQDERLAKPEPTTCWYYYCSKLGSIPYKEHRYCEEHYNLLRKQRFDRVR